MTAKAKGKAGAEVAKRDGGAVASAGVPAEWDCVVDSCILGRGLPHDKGPNGEEILMGPCADESPDPGPLPSPVRVSLSGIVRPLYIFRSAGQWFLAFDLETGGDFDSPIMAVKVGEGGAFSLEAAMGLFYFPKAGKEGGENGAAKGQESAWDAPSGGGVEK